MARKVAAGVRRKAQADKQPWGWGSAASLIVVAVLAVGALLSWLALNEAQPAGRLLAASTRYDAGRVSMREGLVRANFPLTVQGEVLVANIESS